MLSLVMKPRKKVGDVMGTITHPPGLYPVCQKFVVVWVGSLERCLYF